MTAPSELTLQYRWKLVRTDGSPHLLYYGVRNPPRHHEVLVPVSEELAGKLESGAALNDDTPEILALSEQGILVPPGKVRQAATPETMQTCTRCVTNDYVVPGLEFDEEGVCALCRCYELPAPERHSAFATVTEQELRQLGENSHGSRFDAMVLYTGGKDSSFMLWLLARKFGLRVLAVFWDMPYCSEAAYANIHRARTAMPEVEFVQWTISLNTVHRAMAAKWRSHGWPCLCPSPAFALFYPMAARMGIPHVFLGVEDIQAAVLDHVVAPAGPSGTPPTPREQTLRFLATRAVPRPQKVPVRWPDEMANYHAAVRDVLPNEFAELTELVEQASRDENVHLPLIARLETNEAYGTWKDAQHIIETEMGWRRPENQDSLLHTSCVLEPVKDYLQMERFRAMRTVFMPQSMVELGAAVSFGLTPREEALASVKELGYWAPPPVLERLTNDLGVTPEDVAEATDELPSGMARWAGVDHA
jgi:hypothetical protein